MATVAYILATGLSLIVLTWFVLFVLASYTKAIIRGSSEKATRMASIEYTHSHDKNKAIQKCLSVFSEDISISLSGDLTTSITPICNVASDHISIEVTGHLPVMGATFSPITIKEKTNRKLEK